MSAASVSLGVLSVVALANLLLVGVWTSKLDATVGGRTLIKHGRMFWSMSDQNSQYPGHLCFVGVINQAIVSNYGTGYRVGDLIVGLTPTGAPTFSSFVYRVTAVDASDGAVVDWEVLTPGCIDLNQNKTVTTMTAGGSASGFEVIVNSDGSVDPNANDGALYAFPLPPFNLLAPLVEGTYSLYKAGSGGAESYIIEMAPMRYALEMQDHENPHYGLSLFAWGFNTSIGALDPDADWGITVPLTPSARRSMRFTDDADCLADGVDCYIAAYDAGDWCVRDAFNWNQYNFRFGESFYVTDALRWNYGSFSGTFDYGANNATYETVAALNLVL